MTKSFEALVEEAVAAPIDGWDFTWLAGRAHEDRPSWSYFDLVAQATSSVGSLLDLEVGSGGMISALEQLPRLTIGTEGYAPNVPSASERLKSRGAHLLWTDSRGPGLPVRTSSIQLVTSRHPIDTKWTEIARVLQPGGRYLSQQVGPHTLRELTEFLMGPVPPGSKRDPLLARGAAESAGLRVIRLEAERPTTVFYDIGSIVYFLRLVVWIVPGFDVGKYRYRLLDLHRQIERDGEFRATASRFLIEAENQRGLSTPEPRRQTNSKMAEVISVAVADHASLAERARAPDTALATHLLSRRVLIRCISSFDHPELEERNSSPS